MIGYVATNDINHVKAQIIRMMNTYEQQKKQEEEQKRAHHHPAHQDDSVLIRSSNQTESLLLLDDAFDTRNDRNEQQPLSQFNMNELSQMIDHDMSTYHNQNDDASQTESELDDEQAECLGLVKQVPPLKMSTYREYLFWQAQNKVVGKEGSGETET